MDDLVEDSAPYFGGEQQFTDGHDDLVEESAPYLEHTYWNNFKQDQTGAGLQGQNFRRRASVVVLHATSDHELTGRFIDRFKRYIPNVNIYSYEEFAHPGRTVFGNFEEYLEHNQLLLVIVTKNLDEEIVDYLTEIALVDSQTNKDKKGRVIPIWGEENAKRLYKKFTPLHGFDYHGKGDFSKLGKIIEELQMHEDEEFDDLK